MPDDIKVTRFVVSLAPQCRKRHEHYRQKNDIIKFVIQLEVLINDRWHPVIRYDTAHGYAHCDILSYSGKTRKIRIPSLSYKEAMIYADEDLNENWQVYCNRYYKEADYGQ